MKTCSEMLVESPRIISVDWPIEEDFEISTTLIQPTYDRLAKQGFPLSKIKRGKPNGCGFDLKEGSNLVTVYFFCYPSRDLKRTEGFVRIDASTTIPRLIFHIRNKKKEIDYLNRTLPAVSVAIEQNPHFKGVRWVSRKHHHSTSGYSEPHKTN